MYGADFKRDEPAVVLMTRPYKRALMRLAQRVGTDMSNMIRQAIVEYVDSHHAETFNQIYAECMQDYTTAPSKTKE